MSIAHWLITARQTDRHRQPEIQVYCTVTSTLHNRPQACECETRKFPRRGPGRSSGRKININRREHDKVITDRSTCTFNDHPSIKVSSRRERLHHCRSSCLERTSTTRHSALRCRWYLSISCFKQNCFTIDSFGLSWLDLYPQQQLVSHADVA